MKLKRFFFFLALSLSKGLFFAFSLGSNAQATVNLVPNPSFEEFENGCPEEWHELAIGWSNWRGSCNSFSTCVEPQNLVDSLGWAPWTGCGIQMPADGESFCGFSAFSPSPSIDFPQPSFREYLGCELIEPLEIGNTYYVSFKVSTGFKGYYWVTWASSHIGAIFTTQEYFSSGNPMSIPNFAHVYTEEIISDTVNWVSISGTVVADQAYTHLGLGVFFDFDSLNTFQMLDGSNLGSYYFVDDVCVSQYPDCQNVTANEEHTKEYDVTVFPNPASSSVAVHASEEIIGIRIFSTSGQLELAVQPRALEYFIDISQFDSGLYLFEIEFKDHSIKRERLVVGR